MKKIKSISKFITASLIIFCTIPTIVPYSYAFDGSEWTTGGNLAGNITLASEPTDDEDKDDEPENCGGSVAPSQSIADPVYLHNGEFYYNCVDYVLPGRGLDVVINHLYRSGRNNNHQFGWGWTINYNHRLKTLDNGNILLVDGDGRADEYDAISSSNYNPVLPGKFEVLTQNSNGTWTLLKRHKEKWEYDINGNLSKIKKSYGRKKGLYSKKEAHIYESGTLISSDSF